MPYHVRISSTAEPNRDEVRLDLTRDELDRRFLDPYRHGTPIVIGGRTIETRHLNHIRITFTDQYSNRLRKRVLAEAADLRSSRADDWIVAASGRDVTDELIAHPPGTEKQGIALPSRGDIDRRTVFVVHGRDTAALEAMSEFLSAVGLHPLEWSEASKATGKAAPHVGDIVRTAFALAGAVVVLLTPDDEARLRAHLRQADEPAFETELTPQARPNVLFEAGMAMATHEDRTVLVQVGSLRPFSDVAGMHIIRMDGTTQARQMLAQRLESAGCPVNLQGTRWHTVGDFGSDVRVHGDKREGP